MRMFRLYRGKPGIFEVGNAPMAGEELRIISDTPTEIIIKRDGDHWLLISAGTATYEMKDDILDQSDADGLLSRPEGAPEGF